MKERSRILADSEFLDADWAKEAVAVIERVVSEWNLANIEPDLLRIIWGPEGRDDADFQESLPTEHRWQPGLLASGHGECQIAIFKSRSRFMRLHVEFDKAYPLPALTPELYSALCCCNQDFVCPAIIPGSLENDDAILCFGVDIAVPIDGITGHTLWDAIERLDAAGRRLLMCLTNDGPRRDYWTKHSRD